jgi:hypothetical protein
MGTRIQFSKKVSAAGNFTEFEVQRSLSDVALAQTHAVDWKWYGRPLTSKVMRPS